MDPHIDEVCEIKARIAALEVIAVNSKEALVTAKESMEKRLDSMNEFRDTLRDQASKFVTREEMALKFEASDKGRKDNAALIFSIISLGVSILMSIISRLKF